MGSPRRILSLAVLLFGITAGSVAHANGRAELEKARAAYIARNYAEAEARLRTLLDPKSGEREQAVLSQARMFLAAALLAQGKQKDAASVLEKLVLEDPSFEPDPLSFPGEVINTFIDVRTQLQERIREAARNAARLEAERREREEARKRDYDQWLERVKAMAQEEKVAVKSSRLVALLPFGAGQFQNHEPTLGWILLGTQSALVLGTAVSLPMYVYARDRANDEARSGDIDRKADAYRTRADDIRNANLAMAGAFVLVAAAGIVQANLAYVPEHQETRPRSLPPLPQARLRPFVAPLAREGSPVPSGVYLGVAGVAF